MKINGTSKSLALGGLIGTTVAIMYVVNAEDLDGDGFHEFVPGTGISSSQMNYNFDQVTLDFNEVNQSLEETNESLFDLDERLGLFESAIAIDGANIGISGSISAAGFYGDGSNLTNLNASSLTSGTVGSARLGSGTANDTTLLRGDGTWAPVSGVAGSGTANYLPLFTNGTTIGNSAIYQSNGNVGIGTSAPVVNLHVNGVGQTEMRLAASDESAAVFRFYTNTNERAAIYAPGNANTLNFETGGLHRVIIDASGNVGIGTSTPGSKLAVSGGATIGSSYTASVAPSNGMVIEGNVGIGTTSPNQKLEVNGGNIRISQNDQYLELVTGGGGSNDFYGGRWRVHDTGTGVYTTFDTKDNGTWTNDRFTILSSNGNVGIGTTDAEYTLDVEGRVAATSFVTLSDRRLKWDIKPLENASEGLQCLQSVTYRWIDRNDGPPQLSQDRQIGLIAQDVEDCFPEIVSTDSKGFKSVAYDRLVVPLIENAKEQQARYMAQQAVNAAQQAVNAAQQQKIIDLEARLARLENSISKR